MPEEIAIITVIAIMAGTVISILRTVLSYRERTRGVIQPPPAKLPAATGASLTTSELERMMRTAVESATEPLVERVKRLENVLGPAPGRVEDAKAREPEPH